MYVQKIARKGLLSCRLQSILAWRDGRPQKCGAMDHHNKGRSEPRASGGLPAGSGGSPGDLFNENKSTTLHWPILDLAKSLSKGTKGRSRLKFAQRQSYQDMHDCCISTSRKDPLFTVTCTSANSIASNAGISSGKSNSSYKSVQGSHGRWSKKRADDQQNSIDLPTHLDGITDFSHCECLRPCLRHC